MKYPKHSDDKGFTGFYRDRRNALQPVGPMIQVTQLPALARRPVLFYFHADKLCRRHITFPDNIIDRQ